MIDGFFPGCDARENVYRRAQRRKKKERKKNQPGYLCHVTWTELRALGMIKTRIFRWKCKRPQWQTAPNAQILCELKSDEKNVATRKFTNVYTRSLSLIIIFNSFSFAFRDFVCTAHASLTSAFRYVFKGSPQNSGQRANCLSRFTFIANK